MKSFSVTSPFREGQSARPLSVGCGVSRRTGRLWIETANSKTMRRLLSGDCTPDVFLGYATGRSPWNAKLKVPAPYRLRLS